MNKDKEPMVRGEKEKGTNKMIPITEEETTEDVADEVEGYMVDSDQESDEEETDNSETVEVEKGGGGPKRGRENSTSPTLPNNKKQQMTRKS